MKLITFLFVISFHLMAQDDISVSVTKKSLRLLKNNPND